MCAAAHGTHRIHDDIPRTGHDSIETLKFDGGTFSSALSLLLFTERSFCALVAD